MHPASGFGVGVWSPSDYGPPQTPECTRSLSLSQLRGSLGTEPYQTMFGEGVQTPFTYSGPKSRHGAMGGQGRQWSEPSRQDRERGQRRLARGPGLAVEAYAKGSEPLGCQRLKERGLLVGPRQDLSSTG